MNIINYDPFKTMSRLQDEINSYFRSNDFLPIRFDESSVATSEWIPSVDIKEENMQFVIKADIPGVDPKDIDVSMEEGILTIKGERETEKTEEKDDYRRVECSYGSFYRRFSLPDTADGEKIKAKGKDGVLEITVGKKAPSVAKKIKVNS